MHGNRTFVITVAVLILLAIGLRMHKSPLMRITQPITDTTLGRSGEGVHKCHFAGMACYDFISSLALAFLLAWLSRGSVTFWVIVVLLVGEIQHWWFGVPTSTQRWLFGYKS